MTLRTRNRGRTGLKDTALARFGFFAHLRTHVLLAKGYGGASFTRATVATVKDFEGNIRNCLSGEVRFEGQRRVRNLITVISDSPATASGWTGTSGSGGTGTGNTVVADPFGGMSAATYKKTNGVGFAGVFTNPASVVGRQYVGSIWLRRRTGTGTVYLRTLNNADQDITNQLSTSWRRFSTGLATAAGTNVYLVVTLTGDQDEVDLYGGQIEDVTGQSNQNPSEYVSVGAAKLNTLLVTEDFSNGAWATAVAGTGTTATKTPLFAAAPDGSMTACRLQLNKGAGGTLGDHAYMQQSGMGLAGAEIQGVWLKSNDASTYSVALRGGTPTICSVTPAWTFFSNTATSTNLFQLILRGTYGTSDSCDILVWHPQHVLGTVLPDYFPVGNVYPYHGACADGVKYFATENPNVVIDNVVYDTSTQPYTSTKWLRLPGASGAYATTQSAAANQITTDIDIRVRVSADDWTPAGNMMFVSKSDSTGTQRAYFFQLIVTTGRLNFGFSPDGTLGSQVTISSTASPTFDNGAAYWVRVTRDKATGTVTYYTAADSESEPTSWSTLGAAQVLSAGTGIFASSSIVEIGSTATGGAAQLAGNIYRAKIYNSINGTTPVVDFNPSDSTVGGNAVFTSSTTGEVWTVNGTAAIGITPTGRLPTQLDGYSVGHVAGATTDYFECATTASTRPSGNTEVEIEWIGLWQTGTSSTCVLASYGDGGAGRGFLLTINSGVLTWYLSTSGSAWADTGRVATTTVPFADNSLGRIKWVRTTAGVNSFYSSIDRGVTWSKIGSDVSAASGAIYPTTLGYRIGEWAASWAGHGQFHRCIIRDTTAGTTLADFNPREGWTENLLLQSGWSGATSGSPGSAPTSWSVGFGAGTSTTVTNRGDYNSVRFDADNTERVYFSQSINMVAGTRYTVSASLDAVGGSPGIGDMIFLVLGTATGSTVQTVTSPSTTGIKDLIFDCTGSGTCEVRIGIGCSSALGGTVFAEISRPRVRRLSIAGQRTTSGYLPTTTAALRGWISSTGEQWTMNGSATVLQRQADGYLSEPSTTNLVLQSSNFGTTWTAGLTPTRSAAAAYCGDIALDLIGDDDATAGNIEGYSQTITFTADAAKSVSALVRQGSSTSSVIRLRDNTASTDRLLVAITWSSGVPALTFTTGSQERNPEALGNGVFRIFCLTSSVTAANTNVLAIYPAALATLAGSDTGTGNLYCGGVQAENSVMASNLQPTTTGTAGRNADFLYYQDSGNLSASQGSSYIEAGPLVGSGSTQVLLGHGDLTGRMVYNAGTPAVMTTYDGVNSVSSTSTRAPSQMAKVATVWGASSLKISTEAGVGTTSFDGSMGIAGNISVGSAPAGNQMEGLTKNVRIAQVIESSTDMIAVSK